MFAYVKTEAVTAHGKAQFCLVFETKLLFSYSRELNAEALLDLDIFNLSSTSRDDKKKKAGSSSDLRSNDMEDDDELDDKSPLFWQPGKRGYYSPRPGKGSQERLNAFRNIGR